MKTALCAAAAPSLAVPGWLSWAFTSILVSATACDRTGRNSSGHEMTEHEVQVAALVQVLQWGATAG